MDVQYAGFWRRTAALTIDAILFIAIYFALSFVLSDNFFHVSLIYQLLCAAYYIGMTATPMQGTFGQKLLSVKIGTVEGDQVSIIGAVFRYIMWMLPAWPMIIFSALPSTIALTDQMVSYDLTTDDAGAALDLMNSPQMQSFMLWNGILSVIASVGGLIWAISIAVSDQKAGIHDLVCKQRAFKA